MTSAPDIFLSYNREDQARAKLFAEAFEGQGFKVWWDVGLRTGEAYDEVTETALRTAKAVVVLWSKKSVQSRWVRAEATLADRNKTLVPCMIEPCERPIMFELTQTAELGHWDGAPTDKAWLAFVTDVQRFVGRQVTPIPIKETLREIVSEPPKPPETLLAVLPFDNLSSDAEMQFFSDGVSEDILGRIQRGSKLKVIGRTSSFQFRGADKPRAAQSLKATHVLDGSIRRGGSKVRIAAHLTEAATQTTLWSDKYDRDLDDIFAVQDEISEAIASALDTAFFPPKSAPINPAAYDLYLRCRGVLFTNPDTLRRCIPLLESATQQAPNFADAWGLLALMRSWLLMFLPFEERKPVARLIGEETARCRALDADNAMAAAAEWGLVAPFGDFLTMDKILERMAETGARIPEALGLLAHGTEAVGLMREAADHALRLQELDRLNPVTYQARGQTLWRSGRFAEGRAVMERAVANFPDDHHTAILLIIACAHQGDWAAVDALTDPARLAKYPLREHTGVLRLIEVMRDPTSENRQRLLGAVRKRVEATGHADAAPMLFLAYLGFVDETYQLLDDAKLGPAGSPRDQLGPNAYRTHLLFPVAYPELRADPRFVKLCARLGLVEYWLATQKWPDCADVVPYDFRAECERYRDYPKDVFFA
jgi:TolB-like protein